MAGSSNNEMEEALEFSLSLMRKNGKPRKVVVISENPSDISRNNEITIDSLTKKEISTDIFPQNRDLSDILTNYGDLNGIFPNYGNTSHIFPNKGKSIEISQNPGEIFPYIENPSEIFLKNENPRADFHNIGNPIDFFQESAAHAVPQIVNPEPDLDLRLSLGSYFCQIAQEEKNPIALNETAQVNHRISQEVTGKPPAVAAPPKLPHWMVAAHAMAKIMEPAANTTSSSPMHDLTSSTSNHPPVVPSKSMENGQSAHRANKASLHGPMAGCKVDEHGIGDISSHDDLVREAKRAKSSCE